MNAKQQKWVLIIGGLLALLIIGGMLPSKQTKISPEEFKNVSQPSTEGAPQQQETNHTQWDAYGICTQIARNKYGTRDFEFIDAQDMGEDDWIITGTADIEGKSIRWTGEVKYDPSTDKWDIKGWTDNE